MQKEITSPLSVPCLAAQRSIPVGLSVCLSNFTCLHFVCISVSLCLVFCLDWVNAYVCLFVCLCVDKTEPSFIRLRRGKSELWFVGALNGLPFTLLRSSIVSQLQRPHSAALLHLLMSFCHYQTKQPNRFLTNLTAP